MTSPLTSPLSPSRQPLPDPLLHDQRVVIREITNGQAVAGLLVRTKPINIHTPACTKARLTAAVAEVVEADKAERAARAALSALGQSSSGNGKPLAAPIVPNSDGNLEGDSKRTGDMNLCELAFSLGEKEWRLASQAQRSSAKVAKTAQTTTPLHRPVRLKAGVYGRTLVRSRDPHGKKITGSDVRTEPSAKDTAVGLTLEFHRQR